MLRVARRDGGPGGRVVLRPVLRAVLPHPDAARSMREPANLLIAAALLVAHAVLRGVRQRCRTASVARRSSWLGCLLAALTYVPIFKGAHALRATRPSRVPRRAQPVSVDADPNACSFQFDPVGKKKFVQSCDIAKAALAKAGVPYRNEGAPVGSVARCESAMPRRSPRWRAAACQAPTSRRQPRNSPRR